MVGRTESKLIIFSQCSQCVTNGRLVFCSVASMRIQTIGQARASLLMIIMAHCDLQYQATDFSRKGADQGRNMPIMQKILDIWP